MLLTTTFITLLLVLIVAYGHGHDDSLIAVVTVLGLDAVIYKDSSSITSATAAEAAVVPMPSPSTSDGDDAPSVPSTRQQQQQQQQCSCPILTELILLVIQTANLVVSILLEWAMIVLALRGTILNDEPRRRLVPIVLYTRFGLFVCQCCWSVFLLGWLNRYETSAGKQVLFCSAGFELCAAIGFAFSVWCTYDRVGRLKVKMSQVTRRSQERNAVPNKYAESSRPHWRQR